MTTQEGQGRIKVSLCAFGEHSWSCTYCLVKNYYDLESPGDNNVLIWRDIEAHVNWCRGFPAGLSYWKGQLIDDIQYFPAKSERGEDVVYKNNGPSKNPSPVISKARLTDDLRDVFFRKGK